MAAVMDVVGSCAHCGARCHARDAGGVWHCGTEHLLLARLGVPAIAPAAAAAPRRAAAPATDRYASLRASLLQQAVNDRHAAVLRTAARRVRLLREHLEAGLDMLAGHHREQRVVQAVLVHPVVRGALAEMLVTLRGQAAAGEDHPVAPGAGDDPHLRAVALVRELETALLAAATGQRDAQGRSRRAALGLLTYVDTELRRSGRRPEAA
jgi:hypothetical protein